MFFHKTQVFRPVNRGLIFCHDTCEQLFITLLGLLQRNQMRSALVSIWKTLRLKVFGISVKCYLSSSFMQNT